MPYYVPFYLGFQMNIIDPINSTRLLWRCWTSPRFGRDDFLGSKHVEASNRIGYGVALVSPWMALSQQKGCHGYSWHLPTRLHLVTRLCVGSHAVQIKTYPEKTLHVHNVIKHINVFKKNMFLYIYIYIWLSVAYPGTKRMQELFQEPCKPLQPT
jgi:hypothetical protein